MHVQQSRRTFLAKLSGLCGAFPLAAVGLRSQRNPLRRIGFLIGDAPTLIEAFKSEMRALGYVEGQNLLIDVRTAPGRRSRVMPLNWPRQTWNSSLPADFIAAADRVIR